MHHSKPSRAKQGSAGHPGRPACVRDICKHNLGFSLLTCYGAWLLAIGLLPPRPLRAYYNTAGRAGARAWRE